MKKKILVGGLITAATVLTLSGYGLAQKANEQSTEASSQKVEQSASQKKTSEQSAVKTVESTKASQSTNDDAKISLGGEKLPREKGFPEPSGPATFTRAELTPSPKGWIEYGPLSQGRATKANAVIVKSMIGTGTVADPSLRPAGFISGQAPYGHARGHLIGRQLGGSGRTMQNLVTLYQNPVNTPYMTKYENIVRRAAEEGNQVRYRTVPNYKKGQEMPVSVTMEARTINDNSVNFKVVIPNER